MGATSSGINDDRPTALHSLRVVLRGAQGYRDRSDAGRLYGLQGSRGCKSVSRLCPFNMAPCERRDAPAARVQKARLASVLPARYVVGLALRRMQGVRARVCNARGCCRRLDAVKPLKRLCANTLLRKDANTQILI
jgi:hypothetical protein